VGPTKDRQRAWEQRYQSGSTGWDRGAVSPALRHWLESRQVPRGRMLVPGCGHGHEVAELIRAGCDVTAVDIAAQPVMHLTGQLVEQGLHANVVQADLLHWQPPEPFDAIYEQTCICALEPGQWSDYERRLADWLVAGGTLLALFMQTGRAGGPPFDCPVTAMQDLFDPTRWEWLDQPALDVPHPNGLVEHGFVLRRR
jgi:SAM-dependent methyltransferase